MRPSPQTILEVAAEWYKKNCVEQSTNRGVCVDKIHELFDPQWITQKRPEAWCAKFVWVAYQEAATRTGTENPLPRTASARAMLDLSKKAGIPVDNNPKKGDVFYRRSTSPGASGHVGIVAEVTSKGITTVEGNLDNRVAYYNYGWADLMDPKWNFSFIHASGSGVTKAGANGLLALVLVGTAALWYYNKKK